MSSHRGFPHIAKLSSYESDSIRRLPTSSGSLQRSRKITEYRRIEPWQNFYLCSAICSVGLKLSSSIDDFHFYADLTGDNFAYMYSLEVGNPHRIHVDSGFTNSFFAPEYVKKAYATFGYDCIYISQGEIKKDFRGVMRAIKASVDEDIPVLARGIGNVTCSMTYANGTKWGSGPLPEACLIGGYGEDDVLYMNLYPGPERLPEGSVDEYGYSTISNGLLATKGLFFTGEKLPHTDMQEICRDVIDSIPIFLTLPPTEGDDGTYVFGKTAFETWAQTLLVDSFFEGKSDDRLSDITWDLHLSPYCSVCTSSAYGFVRDAARQYPDLGMPAALLPLYKRMQDCRDGIWAMQGGFCPPMDMFRTHGFRAQIAGILLEMGRVCDEILAAYDEAHDTK